MRTAMRAPMRAPARALRRGRRGVTMTIIMVEIAFVLVIFLAGIITFGRITFARDNLQNQTDAIVWAATDVILRDGVDAVCTADNIAVFEALWNLNPGSADGVLQCPTVVTRDNGDGTRTQVITMGISANYEPDFAFGATERQNIQRGAVMEVDESLFDEVEMRRPKFVLVLDYSGSMNGSFGGRTRIQALRAAVNGLLDQRLEIEYGLVNFSSSILNVVGVQYDEQQRDIRDAIGRGAGGGTKYGGPMSKAHELLRNTVDTGYYVLFISDGVPGDGGAGQEAANRARNQDGVTVFTLWIGSGGAAAGVLKAMSGPPGDAGNEDYFFVAGNDAALQDTFSSIVSTVLCSIGPVEFPPDYDADPNEIFTFLEGPRDDDPEIPLKAEFSLDPDDIGEDAMAYTWIAEDAKVRLSTAACNKVLYEEYKVVVRWGRPRLVE